MNSGLDVVACQERKRITGVHGQATIQGLGPLPVSCLVILDLQCRNRLTKEKRQGTKISVTIRPKTITLGQGLLFLFRELAVFHVSQVVFGAVLVLVQVDEEVFRELESNR